MFKQKKKFVPENIYEDEMDKMGRKALLYMKLHGLDSFGVVGLCGKCKSLRRKGTTHYCIRVAKEMMRLHYDMLHDRTTWSTVEERGSICIEWVKYV